MVRLFEILPTGDPHNRTGWDVREYHESYDKPTCIFRGDLSPLQGRDRTVLLLKRLYPGCHVRVNREGK